MKTNEKICIKCQKPVIKLKDDYETFEKMHWICFHLEFEHDADTDEPCHDPSCPWLTIEIYKDKLISLGENPDIILENEFKNIYNKKLS